MTQALARTLQIETPRVCVPALEHADYIGLHGGRGGTKSHFFAGKLIEKSIMQSGLRWMCIREVQRTLDESVKKLLEDTITKYGVGSMFDIQMSRIVTPGGGVIIFVGMQNYNADNIKSLEGFDGAWIEEAQSISERSLNLLRPTIRKEGSEIWASWNPDKETDPIDVLLRGPHPPPSSIVIEVSYKDNPWLPEKLKAEIEYDRLVRTPEAFAHIWEGAYSKNSELRVFKNWTVETFETPAGVMFLFGGDWGFSIDPSVLVRMYLALDEKTLYIDDEVYMVGCEIDDLPALFDTIGEPTPTNDPSLRLEKPEWPKEQKPGMAREWVITADSARPETISYMQKHGYPQMKAAVKGKDSVKEGVIFLQGYRIIVHSRCKHTIDELTWYSYKPHPETKQPTPILQDKKNHVIDSVRYAVEELRHALEEDELTW